MLNGLIRIDEWLSGVSSCGIQTSCQVLGTYHEKCPDRIVEKDGRSYDEHRETDKFVKLERSSNVSAIQLSLRRPNIPLS